MSEAEPLSHEPVNPSSGPPKGALAIIFLIVLIDLLGFGIIIPLLPRYIPSFKEHAFKVTLLFSVYSACQFVGAPVLGALSDRYGRRPVLVISQFGSALGYVLLGFATQWDWGAMTLPLIYASRVIDGFTGGNISTAQAYVSDVTTAENRAKGMGMLGAAFGIGFTLGPFVGGELGRFHVSWPAYLAAALSFAAAVLSLLKLPETRSRTPAETTAWLHPGRFAPVFKSAVLTQLLLISFCIMAAFVMMESTATMFLDENFGWKEREVGLFFGFAGLVIIVVQGGLIGRMTKRYGEWPLATAGPLLVAVGMALYSATAVWPMLSVILIGCAVNAAGRSFQQPTISSLISKFSNPEDHGVVFGLFHGLGSLARVVGPIIAGVTWPFLHHTGQFVTAAVIAVVVGVWTLSLKRPAPHEALPEAMGEAALEPG